MKKIIAFVLAAAVALTLLGCGQDSQPKTTFYYLRNEIQYGVEDGVIAGETRDISVQGNSLAYLIRLYLEGPLSQELTSPFPRSVTLQDIRTEGSTLCVTLSGDFPPNGSNLDHTIACACLAYTCFSLTDAQAVSIQSTDPNAPALTLTRDTLVLDSSITETEPT